MVWNYPAENRTNAEHGWLVKTEEQDVLSDTHCALRGGEHLECGSDVYEAESKVRKESLKACSYGSATQGLREGEKQLPGWPACATMILLT
jgi:hypothetical protein